MISIPVPVPASAANPLPMFVATHIPSNSSSASSASLSLSSSSLSFSLIPPSSQSRPRSPNSNSGRRRSRKEREGDDSLIFAPSTDTAESSVSIPVSLHVANDSNSDTDNGSGESETEAVSVFPCAAPRNRGDPTQHKRSKTDSDPLLFLVDPSSAYSPPLKPPLTVIVPPAKPAAIPPFPSPLRMTIPGAASTAPLSPYKPPPNSPLPSNPDSPPSPVVISSALPLTAFSTLPMVNPSFTTGTLMDKFLKRRGSSPSFVPFLTANSSTPPQSPPSFPSRPSRSVSHISPLRTSQPSLHRSKSLLNSRATQSPQSHSSSHSSQFLLPPLPTPPSPARAPLPSPVAIPLLSNEEAAIDALFSRLAMTDRPAYANTSGIHSPLHRRTSSSSSTYFSLPSPHSGHSPFSSPSPSPTPSANDSEMKEEDENEYPHWYVRVDGVEDEMEASNNTNDGRINNTPTASASSSSSSTSAGPISVSTSTNTIQSSTTSSSIPTSPNTSSSPSSISSGPHDLLIGESMRSFFNSLNLSSDDWITLALAWKWDCATGGIIRRSEFIAGMKSMGCNSILDLKNAINNLRIELISNKLLYRQFYSFVFHFVRVGKSGLIPMYNQPNKRCISIKQSIPLLISLLNQEYEDIIHPLCQYLSYLNNEKRNKSVLTLEEWIKILDWVILIKNNKNTSTNTTTNNNNSNKGKKSELDLMIQALESDNNWPIFIIDYVKWKKDLEKNKITQISIDKTSTNACTINTDNSNNNNNNTVSTNANNHNNSNQNRLDEIRIKDDCYKEKDEEINKNNNENFSLNLNHFIPSSHSFISSYGLPSLPTGPILTGSNNNTASSHTSVSTSISSDSNSIRSIPSLNQDRLYGLSGATVLFNGFAEENQNETQNSNSRRKRAAKHTGPVNSSSLSNPIHFSQGGSSDMAD